MAYLVMTHVAPSMCLDIKYVHTYHLPYDNVLGPVLLLGSPLSKATFCLDLLSQKVADMQMNRGHLDMHLMAIVHPNSFFFRNC